jgi:hypothetical protein
VIYLRVVAVVALLLGASAGIAATRDDAEIQRWINLHAQRSNSEELTLVRSSVVGDLDGDARNDLAMLYTLRPRGGGERGERRYLAAFKRQRDRLHYHGHVLVGGSGAAEVNRATILDKTVVVEMLAHRAGDAACCPTRPATRRYRLAPRGLVLVQEPVKSRAGTP